MCVFQEDGGGLHSKWLDPIETELPVIVSPLILGQESETSQVKLSMTSTEMPLAFSRRVFVHTLGCRVLPLLSARQGCFRPAALLGASTGLCPAGNLCRCFPPHNFLGFFSLLTVSATLLRAASVLRPLCPADS